QPRSRRDGASDPSYERSVSWMSVSGPGCAVGAGTTTGDRTCARAASSTPGPPTSAWADGVAGNAGRQWRYPRSVRAMVLERPGETLRPKDAPDPQPSTGQVRVRVRVCGVCRTDLHIVDGELTDPTLPLVPGHQIVGVVEALGDRVDGVAIGDRVGVPWL